MLDQMGDQHRRGHREHARPQPRRDRRQGDEDGQARVLPEAADALDLGSPPAGEIAREKGVATQMGNQYTAFNPMRKAAYQIRAGQLGTVKEVHVWTNRPIWPQGETPAADEAGAQRR